MKFKFFTQLSILSRVILFVLFVWSKKEHHGFTRVNLYFNGMPVFVLRGDTHC